LCVSGVYVSGVAVWCVRACGVCVRVCVSVVCVCVCVSVCVCCVCAFVCEWWVCV
jgi:hypothetical protein